MRNPGTAKEWQEAVDAANGALAFHSAKLYGLITGGQEVNVARCLEILEAGRKDGFKPSINSIEMFAAGLVGAQRKGKRCR